MCDLKSRDYNIYTLKTNMLKTFGSLIGYSTQEDIHQGDEVTGELSNLEMYHFFFFFI